MLRLFPDCIPCAFAGLLRTLRAASVDEAVEARAIRRAAVVMASWDWTLSAPELGQAMQRLARDVSGCPDPYLQSKTASNEAMLALVPRLRHRIAEARDPLGEALYLSALANRIDFGPGGFDPEQLEQLLLGPSRPTFGHLDRPALDEALQRAQSVVLVLDNAGEIVADMLLIEQLVGKSVTAVVRGRPTINDATMADAEAVGLTALCTVLETESDLPGIPPGPPEAPAKALTTAELIVAKGQGNYETLLGRSLPPTFFLLLAKCPPVAGSLHIPAGRLALVAAEGAP